MKLYIHSIAQAQFAGSAVGTVVTRGERLLRLIEDTILDRPMPEDGQAFFVLADTARTMATAGVAPRTQDPEDYVPRVHRGEVGLYLDRDRFAAKDLVPDAVAVVVYTLKAYLEDPQTTPAQKDEVVAAQAEHVLITVLGMRGPEAPVTPERFAFNLAGGNNAALAASADKLRAEAREVAAYFRTWCVVG